MSKEKKFVIILMIIILLSNSCILLNTAVTPSPYHYCEKNKKPYITSLTLRTKAESDLYDYALYVAQYLNRVGIEIRIRTNNMHTFLGHLLTTHDYDLFIAKNEDIPNFNERIYSKNGNFSIFNLDMSIPYVNMSLQEYDKIKSELSLIEQQNHTHRYQDLMMDKIVPMLPLFKPTAYRLTWSNIMGFMNGWRIIENLPHIHCDGLHLSQESTNELSFPGSWINLNPLLAKDQNSKDFCSLFMTKLLEISPDREPLFSSMITDWEIVEPSMIKFTIRDDVFWGPSFNITSRNEVSEELNPQDINQLMIGLKGEYSNGMNQKVTAKDVIFSLLVYGNSLVSHRSSEFSWISNIFESPTDEYTFYLEIDNDINTPELEPNGEFWWDLDVFILPEFFLNSTDTTITNTTSGLGMVGIYPEILNTSVWQSYSKSAFGSGMYMLDYYDNQKGVSVLEANPHWYNVSVVDNSFQTLEIKKIKVKKFEEDKILTQFIKGNLDYIDLGRELPFNVKSAFSDFRFNAHRYNNDSYVFLGFNVGRPFVGGRNNFKFLTKPGSEAYTKGVAVRKTICYSIDRDEMNNNIHNNEYTIAHVVIFPYTLFHYYEDIVTYKFDLCEAGEWIWSAGYLLCCTSLKNCRNPYSDNCKTSFSIIGLISILFLKRRKKIRK